MRIRLPFAGTFFALLLAAAYMGLTPLHLETYINDKALHLALLPNGRVFDLLDIAANVAGSLARPRPVHVDDGEDLEMGVGGLQEDGVVDAAGARSLEDEVDNWDENAVDEWDEDLGREDVAVGRGKEAAAAGDLGDIGDSKKRSD
ncbi:uncharacterized protein VDAG_00821 [Verticillium dahliae VdLs.17]|uniref:Uncharacterized protein n=1 Tax=Verticillium dahliae (strain VdLs.17 / ATCC MYA-4575 / FGSC 10137) TaxID=498257 RepID=G2WSP0_VERDV|nr:uncharacterized protein VDAG_00821 [Verticillium dahliae VdLs.17]EGY17139.1 hypothetical protein VDAG_00821 [Verticillium dahliae VdLs.17]